MIQPQSYLTVADNTGAKKLMCIRILGNNRKYANVGDVIIGVVKDAIPNMAIKRSNVVRAVIVRTKNKIRRNDGMALRFDDNAVVIINKITIVIVFFLLSLLLSLFIERQFVLRLWSNLLFFTRHPSFATFLFIWAVEIGFRHHQVFV